jgi:hypothetical protein
VAPKAALAAAPRVGPAGAQAVVVGVRHPAAGVVRRQEEVGARQAVVRTGAGRRAAAAVDLRGAIPRVAKLAAGLPAAAPAVGLPAPDLLKAVPMAEAAEAALPEAAVREAVRPVDPLPRVVEGVAAAAGQTAAAASRRIRLADSILGVSGSRRWSPS